MKHCCMLSRTSRRLSVSVLRLPKYGQEWCTRSAHALASRPGPQCVLREDLAPFAPSLHLQRAGAVLGRPRHISRLPIQHARAMAPEANEMLSLHERIEVDVIIEGRPLNGDSNQTHQLSQGLTRDAVEAVRAALQYEAMHEEGDEDVGPSELSVVLCSDEHITRLNGEWRQKAEATDVLSFPMEQDSGDGCPVRMLGDLLISLDTAQRQADERGHTLLDECRILLVHGILHLLGFDHEMGAEESIAMAEAERYVLKSLHWKGQGLIELAGASEDPEGVVDSGSEAMVTSDSSSMASTSYDPDNAELSGAKSRRAVSQIKLICVDMDGTLLDSQSKVLPSSVSAIKAALDQGILVCLATGKARPAAISALQSVGLAGKGLVVSTDGPGIFLQGLAVHGKDGRLLPGKDLPSKVVEEGFRFSADQRVPLAGFLGDTCVTLFLTDELEELHQRYYEPLARIAPSLEEIVQGPPVKKLLFMTDPAIIDANLKPLWEGKLQGQGAELMQAVPNMLEIVPSGVNKRVGLDLLLEDLGLAREAVMALGDGGNDLHIVSHAGIGVAMGNAVPEVKAAATVIVSSNDDDGVAEAIERFVL